MSLLVLLVILALVVALFIKTERATLRTTTVLPPPSRPLPPLTPRPPKSSIGLRSSPPHSPGTDKADKRRVNNANCVCAFDSGSPRSGRRVFFVVILVGKKGVEIEATVWTLTATVWNRPPTWAVSEREPEVSTFPFPVHFVFGTVPMHLIPDEEEGVP